MTFIITLIALILERFFHWTQLRGWSWFARFQYFLNVRIGHWSKYVVLLACVLPPVLLIALLGCIMSGWLYGIPKLLYGLAVMMYCLGPKNLWVEIYSCISALNKEDPHTAVEKVRTTFGLTAIDQPQAFHQAFTRAIFIEANQRIFAVIFWFAVGGPAGAFLYRLIELCVKNEVLGVSQIASQAQGILDWIPVRIVTFLFALAGHFTEVLCPWKRYAKEGITYNHVMLGECGITALGVEKDEKLPEDGSAEKEALALLDRVLVMTLVVIAVFVLIS